MRLSYGKMQAYELKGSTKWISVLHRNR